MATTSAAKQSTAMKDYPNWLAMPHEMMVNILQRFRTAEVLSARKVCTTWRRISKDPALWKVIDIDKHYDHRYTDYGLEMLIKQAVHLSCGELTDISISGFGTDDLLDHIVLRSSKLNRVNLGDCKDITASGLIRAVKRVPQLEKLHLFNTSLNAKDIEVIGQNCPQLKSFRMCKWDRGASTNYNDNARAIANNMVELCNLELLDRGMTNDGLEAILSGCPHLETLDVRGCHNLDLDGYVGNLCMERIKDFKSDYNEDDWYDNQTCECDCFVYDSPDDSDHSGRYYMDDYIIYEYYGLL